MIKFGIYSSRQLFITAIIGGPAIAGFIAACNLWARGKRFFAIIPVLVGLLFDFILIIPVYLISRNIESLAFRNLLAISILFLLQTVFAFLIQVYFKKNKLRIFIFPEMDEKIYYRRKTFPVIVISVIYFFTDFVFPFYSWIILGFYLFPHFYGYLLISKTFEKNRHVNLILSLIVFFACFVPFVTTTIEYLSAFTSKGILFYTYLNLIVGYYAVFVIYLVLFIFGFNIFMFVNWLLRIVPSRILKSKKLVIVVMLSAIAFTTITLITGSYLNNNPIINTYSITIPKKSSTINSLKVVSVADLHLKKLTSIRFLHVLVNKIRLANPDIIVLPGDIVETNGNIDKEQLNEFLEVLKDIKTNYGIYAVKGNHDYTGDMADKTGFYKRLGIKMLTDSLIEVDDKFCIIGLNYRGNNERRPLDSLLRFKTKDLPMLMLDHAPYCLEEALKNKIDVQFSGHTHYGQIWPFSYITELVYEIAWGYKQINNTHIFVSCGVQDALLPGRQDFSIPVRIGSDSEIMEVNIDFKSADDK